MATPFNDIYKRFLSNVKDVPLVNNFSVVELEEILFGFMETSASLRFKKCKQNLEDVDLIQKQFNIDLTKEEQIILSKCMVLEWLEPYVNNEQNLKNGLTTKDYKMFSPANTLESIKKLFNETNSESKKLIRSYLYNGFKGYGKT